MFRVLALALMLTLGAFSAQANGGRVDKHGGHVPPPPHNDQRNAPPPPQGEHRNAPPPRDARQSDHQTPPPRDVREQGHRPPPPRDMKNPPRNGQRSDVDRPSQEDAEWKALMI